MITRGTRRNYWLHYAIARAYDEVSPATLEVKHQPTPARLHKHLVICTKQADEGVKMVGAVLSDPEPEITEDWRVLRVIDLDTGKEVELD